MTNITEFLNNFKIFLKLKKNIYITKKTKLIYQITNILKIYGYITNIFYIKIKKIEWIIIYIEYKNNYLILAIQEIKIFNNKSKEVFLSYKEIQKYNNKKEFIIVSTSKEIISGKMAYNLKIGGKLLCSIK